MLEQRFAAPLCSQMMKFATRLDLLFLIVACVLCGFLQKIRTDWAPKSGAKSLPPSQTGCDVAWKFSLRVEQSQRLSDSNFARVKLRLLSLSHPHRNPTQPQW